MATVVVLASLPVVGCSGVEELVGEACDETPADRAPTGGNCTAVDWDVVTIDDRSVSIEYYVNDPGCSGELDRVNIAEDDSTVRITVLVEFNGGGSCPTSLASREAVVELAAPLGDRALLGCRPANSFVPAGGYNEQRAPRDGNFDCAAG